MKKPLLTATFFLFIICFAAPVYAGGMIENVDTYGVTLTEDTTVTVNDGDLLLQKGSSALFYNKDGEKTDRLYMGRLAADASFSVRGKALTVPASNVVWFHESGNIKYTTAISEPAVFEVQGKEVLFNAAYDVYMPMGFHDNGRLMRGSLAETTGFMLQGSPVPFKGTAVFSDTEQLLYGILAEDADITIQGKTITVPADAAAAFYENGAVKECGFLTVDTCFRVQEKSVLFTSHNSNATSTFFYPDGTVLSGSLAEDTVFTVGDADIRFKAKTVILFYETAAVKTGFLAEDSDLFFNAEPIRLAPGSAVEFDEDGNLIRFVRP